MNKIITTFATMLLTTAVIAAPGGRGGNRGNNAGHGAAPARQVQKTQQMRKAQPVQQVQRHEQNRRTDTFRHHGRNRPDDRHCRPMHCGRRHWYRPAMPPPRPRACYTWTWIATPWTIFVDGVYCTGDGYWFDGYNYYYNDAYFTNAPISINITF